MHKVLGAAILTAALLSVHAGHAQMKKYPYVQDGKIIVCREGNDGVKSSLIHATWFSTETGKENDASHNGVAAKFEVATSDAEDGNIMLWRYAVASACPTTYGWRLPTVRELRLIYALRNELTSANLSVGGDSDNTYWSATESSNNSDNAWSVSFFNNGITTTKDKSSSYRVRCVRDR